MEETEGQGSDAGARLLEDPIGLLRRRWRWMALVFVAGALAATTYVWRMPVRYATQAKVLVTSQRIPSDFVRTTITDELLQRVDALAAGVLTRERLASFVQKYGLYAGLRDTETLDDITAKVRGDIAIQPEPSIAPRLRRDDSSAVFNIIVAAHSPNAAADMANEIAGLLTSEAVRTRTQQAELTTAFLRRELERAERELREQERQITEYKSSHRGELPGDELQANLARLERLQQQRQSLALQIAESSTRVATVLAAPGAEPVTPQDRLTKVREDIASELAVKTEAHPDVVALRAQLQALEAEIGQSGTPEAPVATTGGLVAAEMETVKELRSQLAAADRAIRELDARVAQTPLRQEELGAMEQKAAVLQEDYEEFLRKVRDAELAESLERAQQGERISVLDRAFPPSRPDGSRLKILALGIAVSLAAAAGVGALLELVDPVVANVRQAEEASQIPVLGSVARIA